MTFQNNYGLLTTMKVDPYSTFTNQFILQPHQVIPKYYLLSDPDRTSLILHYSLGSGKSATAVFIILHHLKIFKSLQFNKQFSPHHQFLKSLRIQRNVIVVGSWQTTAQFIQELRRPEFDLVDPERIKEIDKLLKSPVEEQRLEGESKNVMIIREINQMVLFRGYQAFFNLVFPEVQAGQYVQDISALIIEYERGTLKVSESFINTAKGSIIVVDEMQRLYSNGGLNSYGFAVACVNRIAKQHGIKLVYLSGTMLNTSLGEVPDVLNLIIPNNPFNQSDKFITREDICVDDTILGDIPVSRIRKSLLPKIQEIFRPRFMYYAQTQSAGSSVPTVVSISQLTCSDKPVFISESCGKMSAMVFPRNNYLLPLEIHVGNKTISGENTPQPMHAYAIQLEGRQADAYKQYVANGISSGLNALLADDSGESDRSKSVSIQDALLPPSNEWNKLGIYRDGDVLYGKFLAFDNLRQFSAVGYELGRLCFENTWHNEKTVVYHNRLNNFGIKQYGAILRYNGFVLYGDNPSKDSLCKECRGTYQDHAKNLDERLKLKICNHFKPMIYDMITGDLDQQSRDNRTNNVYNSPNNLYGDLISVVFVSDVAYAGVSFFNTNNLVIISRIPNMSKWKQIYGRIIRTKSHALMPPDKQYAKIYTYIVELPRETKVFPKLNGLTYGERYYRLRCELNTDILEFTRSLADTCISKQLLEHPETYVATPAEDKTVRELIDIDLEQETKRIITRIMVDNTSMAWGWDVLYKRLVDNSLGTSFLPLSNIPSDALYDRLAKIESYSGESHNKLVRFFVYTNDQTKYLMVELTNTTRVVSEKHVTTFPFSAINAINIRNTALNNMFAQLNQLRDDETAGKQVTYASKVDILSRIVKTVGTHFDKLVDRPAFWDFMYDIGNEYYADDETNFVANHTPSGRSRGKMVGCYNNQVIVFRDGTFKQISYVFPVVSGTKDLPFKFKITCLANSAVSPFYIHVVVIRKGTEKEVTDRRRVMKGLVCVSMDTKEFHKYFPKIDKTLHKKKYCNELIYHVCELQQSSKDKFIYTPFEK